MKSATSSRNLKRPHSPPSQSLLILTVQLNRGRRAI